MKNKEGLVAGLVTTFKHAVACVRDGWQANKQVAQEQPPLTLREEAQLVGRGLKRTFASALCMLGVPGVRQTDDDRWTIVIPSDSAQSDEPKSP
ncbi:MAG: hypothetical protein GC137_02585 [Alphaproteobacteria bacterium]|nr:hypothetical protein [Alphaproteobacteria bacterium]